METWIRSACRQRAYRQLVVWGIVTAMVIGAAFASGKYWKNFMAGPYQVPASDLANITDINDSGMRFVAVTGDKVVPSGIEEITTETENGVKEDSYVSSEYFILLMKDKRLLIVKSQGTPSLHVTGVMKSTPAELADRIFPNAADSDLKARLYPFYLSTTDNYRLTGYFALSGLLVYIVLLWLFAGRAWRRANDVTLHPVVARIEKLPNAMELAANSESEMRSSVRFRKSGLVITDNFLIQTRFFTFNLGRFDDLIWAYRKVTTRFVGIIPVARTNECVFIFYGVTLSFPSRKKRVKELLTFASQRAPWAIIGYTSELAKLFKKNTAGFCASVEERRHQILAR